MKLLPPVPRASAAQARDATNGSAFLTPQSLADAAVRRILFYLPAPDMNVTTDQVFTKLGTFTNYILEGVTALNASVSMTTAAGGIYTGAAKSGIIITAASQTYAAANAVDSGLAIGIAATGRRVLSATPILSLTTPQGAPASFGHIVVIGCAFPL